jgi:hypothetical protein
MNLYKHLLALKEAGQTICIHDVRYVGVEHNFETRHIVHDFDEEWICLKNVPGGDDSYQFVSIRSISSCCITNYSRRKTPRD